MRALLCRKRGRLYGLSARCLLFFLRTAPTSLRLMYWPLVRSKVRETLKLSSLTLNRSPTPRARPGVVRPSMSYSTVKGMEISWVSLSCKSADGKRRSLGSCSLGWATQSWSCRTVPSSFEVHYKERGSQGRCFTVNHRGPSGK